MHVTTIGLDLAKNVFQVHGITNDGEVAFNRPLRRAQVLTFFEKLEPCLVGIEACGTSHHWARELIKLGHNVKLIPPVYVKPYVKRGKTDAADAEAICEAVTRPTMRFVEVKTPEQQAIEDANYLLDTAALTGGKWSEIRSKLGDIYHAGGKDDMAAFVDPSFT